MIDMLAGILGIFAEAQERFGVWSTPLGMTRSTIRRALQRQAGCSLDRTTLVDRSAFRYGDVRAYLAAMEAQRIETARLAALRKAWAPRRKRPRGHTAGLPKRCSECGQRGHRRPACAEMARAA